MVTFLGKDGVLLKNQTVKAGEDAVAPEAPVVDGFTFKGWDKEYTNIQGNLTVNAVYERVSVKPELDSGTIPQTGDQTRILSLAVSILLALGVAFVLIRNKRRFKR